MNSVKTPASPTLKQAPDFKNPSQPEPVKIHDEGLQVTEQRQLHRRTTSDLTLSEDPLAYQPETEVLSLTVETGRDPKTPAEEVTLHVYDSDDELTVPANALPAFHEAVPKLANKPKTYSMNASRLAETVVSNVHRVGYEFTSGWSGILKRIGIPKEDYPKPLSLKFGGVQDLKGALKWPTTADLSTLQGTHRDPDTVQPGDILVNLKNPRCDSWLELGIKVAEWFAFKASPSGQQCIHSGIFCGPVEFGDSKPLSDVIVEATATAGNELHDGDGMRPSAVFRYCGPQIAVNPNGERVPLVDQNGKARQLTQEEMDAGWRLIFKQIPEQIRDLTLKVAQENIPYGYVSYALMPFITHRHDALDKISNGGPAKEHMKANICSELAMYIAIAVLEKNGIIDHGLGNPTQAPCVNFDVFRHSKYFQQAGYYHAAPIVQELGTERSKITSRDVQLLANEWETNKVRYSSEVKSAQGRVLFTQRRKGRRKQYHFKIEDDKTKPSGWLRKRGLRNLQNRTAKLLTEIVQREAGKPASKEFEAWLKAERNKKGNGGSIRPDVLTHMLKVIDDIHQRHGFTLEDFEDAAENAEPGHRIQLTTRKTTADYNKRKTVKETTLRSGKKLVRKGALNAKLRLQIGRAIERNSTPIKRAQIVRKLLKNHRSEWKAVSKPKNMQVVLQVIKSELAGFQAPQAKFAARLTPVQNTAEAPQDGVASSSESLVADNANERTPLLLSKKEPESSKQSAQS